MYRLSGVQSALIQRLVSQEIIRGIDALFGTIDNSDIVPAASMEKFIRYSEVLARVGGQYPLLPTVLSVKLTAMRRAMKDPDYEYTFDEFGEFLLYEMIQYARDIPGMMLEWESGANAKEEEILRKIVEGTLSDADDLALEEKTDLIQQTVDAITCFPNLADELDGLTAFDFLYWDTDFMLYYDVIFDVISDLFQQDDQMGFSGGEMQKYPIIKDE